MVAVTAGGGSSNDWGASECVKSRGEKEWSTGAEQGGL